jgi:hypothetical protein
MKLGYDNNSSQFSFNKVISDSKQFSGAGMESAGFNLFYFLTKFLEINSFEYRLVNSGFLAKSEYLELKEFSDFQVN